MAQQVKVPVVKPNELSSTPRTLNRVQGEKWHLQVILWLHIYAMVHMNVNMKPHKVVLNKWF